MPPGVTRGVRFLGLRRVISGWVAGNMAITMCSGVFSVAALLASAESIFRPSPLAVAVLATHPS